MIRFSNVSKYYPSKSGLQFVFRNVSLEIPTDRNIGLLGPNGVGKSTFMKMVGGSDRPSKGRITTDQKISWPIGLGGGLQGSMTARENIRFVARINGYKDSSSIEQFVEEFAEIGKYFDEPIKAYSSGMKARVGFGLSFAFDFDVLLMDEVGAVGDQNFKKKSAKLLKEKTSRSKVILVSHSIGEHRKICESGLVIKNEGLVFYDALDDAIEDYEHTYVK
ncbi:MAG: ABC transporter ATP-binding protein [Gammaproteobacteria bacterium]|nr:MAG: ABC transporter ATP-binding protein [Gammaproteobacteria bacterium]